MTNFDDVREFHKVMDLVSRNTPTIVSEADWGRRHALITEEFDELEVAYLTGDLVAFADALADLTYVVLGTAVEAGIPFDEVWAEVHRTNMLKVGGPVRADGKKLKPVGWTPPDIASIIANHSNTSEE